MCLPCCCLLFLFLFLHKGNHKQLIKKKSAYFNTDNRNAKPMVENSPPHTSTVTRPISGSQRENFLPGRYEMLFSFLIQIPYLGKEINSENKCCTLALVRRLQL